MKKSNRETGGGYFSTTNRKQGVKSRSAKYNGV